MLLYIDEHSCEGGNVLLYRNIIASSSPREQILFFFEKIRFASQKLNFSIFCFFSKKPIKMTLNSLEVTKCYKN